MTSNDVTAALLPDRLEPLPNEVHVVRICLDQTVGGGIELLDEGERERATRLVFERDRKRFIVAHVWVRIALGRCLDRAPESLKFAVGSRGKPHLVDASVDLRFNLSHAGERALLALTLGQDVGVDIEEERPIEVLEIARRFFAPSESEALHALASSEQVPAFFRCWTRKEAFIKAIGEGMSLPLDGFEVSLADDRSPQQLRASTAEPLAPQRWRIVSLPSEAGYAAAVAANAGDWRVVRWNAAARNA